MSEAMNGAASPVAEKLNPLPQPVSEQIVIPNDQPLVFHLYAPAIQVIFALLDKAPHGIAAPVFNSMVEQIRMQIQPKESS